MRLLCYGVHYACEKLSRWRKYETRAGQKIGWLRRTVDRVKVKLIRCCVVSISVILSLIEQSY